MLSGTRHGLRRLSFSQAPFDNATTSRNELFLPFLYPRESFSVLTKERCVRRSRLLLTVGNNRLNGSSSNCCRQTSLNPNHTSRRYTAPSSSSNVSDSTRPSESGNVNNGEKSKEIYTGASSVHDTCSATSGASPESSPEQSTDILKEDEATGSDSTVPLRIIRSEKWWRKLLDREIARRPPLRQNRRYMEWMDVMEEIKALSRDKVDRPAPSYAKTIYLCEPDVVALAGDERENVWDISVLSGCRVHILPRERESRDSMRKVVLTGSPEAVKLAEEEIKSDIKTFHETSGVLPGSLSPFVTAHDWKQEQDIGTPTVRSVWNDTIPVLAEGKRSRTSIRADALPRPEKWTIKNFGDYLESLTNLAFSSPVHSVLHRDGRLNRAIIIDIIQKLFTGPDTKQFLSTRAVNFVIFYCYRYTEYLPVLLSLFPNFEHLMTTRTFNALLTRCSANHDINRFRYLISLMKRWGVKPNGLEWVAFVDTILGSKVKLKVVAHVYNERLIHDERILRFLVYRIIPPTFTSHLESGQSVKDYLALMERRHGQSWICTESITRMLGVTVRLHHTDAAHEVLQFCKQRGMLLDVQGMNYCLAVHLTRKQYKETIAVYLDLVSQYRGLRPNDETIRILFYAAWEARYYNTCRVVWAYACFWGLTTSSMKHMVLLSLFRNTTSKLGNDAEMDWVKKAGKAIVGINPIMSELDSRFDVLINAPRTPAQELLESDNVMSLLTEYQPEGVLRDRQRKLAHWVIYGDFLAVWRYKPLAKFQEMMWEANVLDMAWWAQGHARNMSVAEIVRDVIQIPVEQRESWKDKDKYTRDLQRNRLEEDRRVGEQERELEQQPQEPEPDSQEAQAEEQALKQALERALERAVERVRERTGERTTERELERGLEQEQEQEQQRQEEQQQDIKGKEEKRGEGVNKDPTIVSNAKPTQPKPRVKRTGHREGWVGRRVSIDEVKVLFEKQGISWKGRGSS
ncbi:hypothetical protein GX51_08228 [Blastomyces parvus]|uniref:K Homology domain-containing protein n=1 Tax=Blastomyces parvus TaxID=2060905 RepID=A0A2B7WFR1_9EURO|nr:hypothetical protein GX51_08228 [Blastomyces parvus]